MSKQVVMLFGILLLLFGNGSLFAEGYTISMKRYTSKEGLSNRSINKIIQDKAGFLWIATSSGLNRFDGYEFTQFLEKKIIRDLALSPEGVLWIATSESIYKLPLNTLKLEQLPSPKISGIKHIELWQDKVLYANADHLFLMAPDRPEQAQEIFSTLSFPNRKSKFSTTRFHYVIVDRQNHIWLGLGASGLHKINGKGEVIARYGHYTEKGYRRLHNDQQGNMRILGVNQRFLQKGERDSVFTPPNFPQQIACYQTKALYHSNLLAVKQVGNKSLKSIERVYQIASIDTHSYYLFSTTHSGIYLWEKKLNKLTAFEFEELTTVDEAFVDRNQTLWVSTADGLISIHIKKNAITTYLKNTPLLNGTSASMRGIAEDKNGIIWMNSYQGIYRLDTSGGFAEWDYPILQFGENRAFKGSRRFNYYRVLPEEKGIWFTSDSHSCYYYDYDKNRLFRAGNNLGGWRFFYAIARGENGKLWIGGRAGLFEVNEVDLTLQPFLFQDTTTTKLSEICDLILKQDTAWLASKKGIYLVDLAQQKLIKHYHTSNGLTHDYVLDLFSDQAGWMWAGTRGGGLLRIDPQSDDIQQFTKQSHELSDDFICAIEAENDSILWLGSFNGLMRFNKNTFEVTSFFESDGLTDDEFNHSASFKAKDGRMFFGGIQGVNAFYPDELVKRSSTYRVLLSSLTIYDQNKKAFEEVTQQFLEQRQLEWKPEADFLDIEFSMDDFSNPTQLDYAYKLEGRDEVWMNLEKQHRLRITKPKAGEYTLLIKGRASNGIWSDQILKIPIKSLRPFYEDPKFILLVITSLIAVLYAIVRFRIRQLEQNQVKLEQVVAERTEELVIEKQKVEAQAERLQALDQTKSRFFANISHELRTPLTLILGQLNYLAEQEQPLSLSAVKEELNITEQNAQQLLVLIEEIMDLSKLEAGKLTLQKQTTQLYTLFTQLIETYQSLIRQKSISLHWDFQLPEHNPVLIDRNKFKKILHNLLSNAFKYTPEEGEVFVRIQEVKRDNQPMMLITVADTGRGIHPNDLPHIFDRFYQSEQADTPTEGGTGIGLALVKELIALMKGEVSVESELGKRTTFQVTLPLEFADDKYLETSISNAEPLGYPYSSIDHEIQEIPNLSFKPTLLIVDDHEQMRQFLKKCLEEHYIIFEAYDGVHALETLAKQQVDLVLSDLMMPRMDGYQLLEQLKTEPQTRFLPTIMLTARADMEDKLRALAIGVNEYMLKPFHPNELRIRIKNLIHFSLERKKWLAELQSFAANQEAITPDQELLEKAKVHALKHLANSNYGVADLAEALSLSQRSLARKLKTATGLSPLQFINELRLQEARKLLELGIKSTVAEVMYEVGYRSGGHFSRNFQKRFGTSPSKLLESNKKA
ncbi:MAG: ATP-binding protein [Flammeovirgaceae bacterium]